VVVRSWNLFHGNTVPPQRRAFLDEMIALATADRPAVFCAQEVPAWALSRFTVGDVAAPPRIGPLPIPTVVGRALTAPNHGLLRSAFAGQGNAIQLDRGLRLLSHRVETLNARRFRRAEARELYLDAETMRKWGSERRIVQAVRLAADDGRTFLLANMHCSGHVQDRRLPDVELLRAAWFAESLAEPGDVVVLAGDFNVYAATSRTLRELTRREWGFSPPGPGIDHILVRGAASSPVRVWPPERRARGNALLSDHAPVEVEIE
jgi:Endonuclease/Exonuclease/phosphatase family